VSRFRRVCVFCGSNRGARPEYAAAAEELARALARARIGIVFGGGRVGLMGVVADAALAEGGEVIGVIPYDLLVREVAHEGVEPMHVVGSMHERKAKMNDLSDAFVALPGGYGTFEELMEIVTWAQLGMHAKPVAVLDVAGYYEPLFAQLDRAAADGFLAPENRELVLRARTVPELLARLEGFTPRATRTWIDRAST
jgi:uncharacterized protein (TIGR00730 family)